MHVPCGSQTFHDSRLQRQPEGTDDERAGSRPRRDHTDQGLENHSIPLSAAAEVPVEYQCFDGLIHGSFTMSALIPSVKGMYDLIQEYLASKLQRA